MWKFHEIPINSLHPTWLHVGVLNIFTGEGLIGPVPAIRGLGLRRKQRATAKRCFCPPDSMMPATPAMGPIQWEAGPLGQLNKALVTSHRNIGKRCAKHTSISVSNPLSNGSSSPAFLSDTSVIAFFHFQNELMCICCFASLDDFFLQICVMWYWPRSLEIDLWGCAQHKS